MEHREIQVDEDVKKFVVDTMLLFFKIIFTTFLS